VFLVVALVAFVPLTFVAFSSLGPRRGALASLLGGWLLLPWFDGVLRLPVLTSKRMLVPAVVVGVSLLVDGARWRKLKLGWLDLPVALWCLGQIASSVDNDLGAYDGVHAALEMAISWGLPYLLARLYFGDAPGIRDLALGLVLAALAYVPLCLWEIRMSPQLHRVFYGYSTLGEYFGQAIRFGGYRPSVFLSHGLMLAMFMANSTLVACWLWRTGAVRSVRGVKMGWICLTLLVTTVLCKSTGAILLLLVGLALLWSTRWLKASWLLAGFLALAPAFCTARLSGWTGHDLVAAAEKYINAERAQSLAFRVHQENALIGKAMRHPLFGWGRWGGARLYDEDGKDVSITDSLWIIELGNSGAVGLAALGAILLLPGLALLRRFPARRWPDPQVAAAAALAVTGGLVALDSLLNAMVTPLFPAAAGAVTTFCGASLATRRRRAAAPARPPAASPAAPPGTSPPAPPGASPAGPPPRARLEGEPG